MNELLLQLRDKGNTVLVVEHNPEMIGITDHVVDLGPGAGSGGGEVTFEGDVSGLRLSDTVTAKHLDDRAKVKLALRAASEALEVRGANTNSLDNVDVDIPRGLFVVVTGVARFWQELTAGRFRVRARRRRHGRPGRNQRVEA